MAVPPRKAMFTPLVLVFFILFPEKKLLLEQRQWELRLPLASIMLAALKNSPNSMNMFSLKEIVDPNMMDLYLHDCLFKIAMLAKQCVDDDPILRPNMKQVVISLSQILLCSIRWEATLA
ncbi:LysM domain receptor-like kinase 3 [Raphanus sativus]|nr:LysM domain receptor-like kinase 3 [Raphanus sativus]